MIEMDAFVIQSNTELGITMNFKDDIPLEWKQNQKMKILRHYTVNTIWWEFKPPLISITTNAL